MTLSVAALTGLSGVGKSTLLQELTSTLKFQHLQASTLIRTARRLDEHSSTDHLRLVNLDENQKLLIHAFADAADMHETLIVLDAHTVIELEDREILIAADIFRAIGINRMIFLSDDCAEIARRRSNDPTRQRQIKSVQKLREVQDLALQHAKDICRDLAVPLSIVESYDATSVAQLLRIAGASPSSPE